MLLLLCAMVGVVFALGFASGTVWNELAEDEEWADANPASRAMQSIRLYLNQHSH